MLVWSSANKCVGKGSDDGLGDSDSKEAPANALPERGTGLRGDFVADCFFLLPLTRPLDPD